jgi:hypothetical protein
MDGLKVGFCPLKNPFMARVAALDKQKMDGKSTEF